MTIGKKREGGWWRRRGMNFLTHNLVRVIER
jgi:hypothetical protein